MSHRPRFMHVLLPLMRNAFRIACFSLIAVVLLTGSVIQEQQARLPPPATCDDSVEGIWKAHAFSEVHDQWYLIELHVRRVKGSDTEIKGDMRFEIWTGDENRHVPPSCDKTDFRARVFQNAKGTVEENAIQFQAIDVEIERVCGLVFGYNLDAFGGTINPDTEEFHSLANDGGMWVNFPVVFRRVRCFMSDDDIPYVAPPPFQPRTISGCWR